MRSMLVTAILVVLALLAVAIYARSHRVGPMRSVAFSNPGITFTTNLNRPVVVILEAVGPGGTTTPLGWANLGETQANINVGSLTIPPGTPLQLRWSFDQQLTFIDSTKITSAVIPTATVTGGNVATFGQGALTFQAMGRRVTGLGTTPLNIAPGQFYQIDFGQHGPTISPFGAPLPPPPSTPPTPPPQSPPPAQAPGTQAPGAPAAPPP